MREQGPLSAWLWLGAVLLLAACGSSDESLSPTPPSPVPKTRYDMANGCYALQAVANAGYALREESGAYSCAAGDAAEATRFFMKPTALGKYLFYAEDRSMLALAGGGTEVGSVLAPGAAADWTVDLDPDGDYSVYSESAGRYLALNDADGRLVLATEPGKFQFVPTEGCMAFPEISVDAEGEPFKGRGVEQPVLGFAEVHAHISATSFLGGAHYGTPFHKYGVTEAMGNCRVQHGPAGILDLIGNLYGGNPLATHDTQGWPTFVDWPARDSLLHEGMYYKWVERAYLAGMRLMVNDLVENQVLCSLQSVINTANALNIDVAEILRGVVDLVVPPYCNEMNSAIGQISFMHELQDYIDAQEGGPGKGWFRIVTTPREARQVINDGKLAVVLGIEISHLFNCRVMQPGGLFEVAACDEAQIDAEMDRLYELGVRQMFPIHEFDNAFGGNGIFDGLILNVGNFLDTGSFWQTYTCPDQPYFFQAGAEMTTALLPAPLDPLTELLTQITQGLVPLYPQGHQCNARWMTPLGRYAFDRMMDKKIMIEVDHLELEMKTQLLDMAGSRTPAYPLLSTHGGQGGISMEQARRLLAGGGLLYPNKGNGIQFTEQLNLLRSVASEGKLFAMGYGADMNGLANQSAPRGAAAEPVRYPYTLFRGPGWGAQFAAVQPIVFQQSAVPEGDRLFDINAEGLAHYGLIADWIEEVRLEGGEQAITDLYNSAELYLQTWERTLNR
ncbi:MAG: peptidase M19 [Nevskiaceae bacterium]|nr:MAG: peptidase M19 [Nevskiaceae bacterium]TAM28392.1 MAG: peptidase M19 [Nevskiaceae bacterium]